MLWKTWASKWEKRILPTLTSSTTPKTSMTANPSPKSCISRSSRYGRIQICNAPGPEGMKLPFLKSMLHAFPYAPRHSLTSACSLGYFFQHLDRLFSPDFRPNEQDIIHCRARTIGITETTFRLREHDMLMVDVGGQKSERRKWIHCFQDVTSILFLVSLSGYDQCLVEDKDAVRCWFLSLVQLPTSFWCRIKCRMR